MTTTNYSIDSGDGNQLTAGLPEQTAHRIAQRMADERNESVYLYADGDEEAEEIAPTEIEVEIECERCEGCGALHTLVGGNGLRHDCQDCNGTGLRATGPRVRYGAQDAETVEAEIPEGWRVDWSNAQSIAPTGTHRIRYSAPLVHDDAKIHLAISDGSPSEHYTDEEQTRNGATDYDVTLTIGDREIEGGITLYRDDVNGGRMAPCGAPLDGWVSASLVAEIRKMDDGLAKRVIQALAALSEGEV